ncbi:DUF4388 domain-containing protein [Polyangium mundeleinium]|uniref:DUF4388 domain-containing protein n=1 Tax=Polyangium mundeleinium TaxID=2995306 RepID=A0ABT5EYW4_9BACT|nr:DUF4388 domain-containing protein [Polyangium mundeleinium]MDC0747028.1 DUF4388 domain-containing protein [Polyangium mundeleinium]
MESQLPKVSPPRRLALRFISGKYQGGEFLLEDKKEIIVGRSSELDMVLVEDMVSRKHARIACGDPITIEDLGSTNGTFVNGERIKRATLKEGDRVLIGTNILKVVVAEGSSPGIRLPKRSEQPPSGRSPTRSMSGAIDEIPLPDLLQLLGSSKKTGLLVIRTDDEVGKIHLQKGTIIHASLDDSTDLPPLKAAYRILAWGSGTFDFEPPDEVLPKDPIDVSVQEILMEGLRQLDELNAIKHKLPGKNAQLSVALPLKPLIRDLSPMELDVLQAVWNHAEMHVVMDKSTTSDLDTGRTLLKLISSGYVRVE